MSFINNIRKKIEDEKKKFRFKQQIGAEKKARRLENEAKFAKSLGDRLERQEKSRKIIEKIKSIQKKQTANKIKRILEPLQQQTNQQSNNMDFFGTTTKTQKSNDDFFKL